MGVASLTPEQKKAIYKLDNGKILCGGVGSGKSRTSLGYFYYCHGGDIETSAFLGMVGKPSDLYIITTAQKRDKHEWDLELAHFHMDVGVNKPHGNIVVVDSWNNILKYKNVKNAFFIFDEQRLVGSGKWVYAFLTIAKHNRWILCSATPGDQWSDYIPVFIANGYYKNRSQFLREHVVYKPYMSYPVIDRYLGTGKLVALRNRLLVDIDVSRHTIRHNEDVYVEFDPFEYKRIYKERWNIYSNAPIKTAAELCSVLRRSINSNVSRQIATIELVEKAGRAIIFYNYDFELDILKGLMYGDDVEVAEWNGHKHQPVPQSDKWVYLVQFNAGCEGWNCISANTIIFYSQNYSYRKMEQASGRIDRMNTPYIHLFYYHLKSRSGIDLAIAKALREKKTFNESRFVNRGKERAA